MSAIMVHIFSFQNSDMNCAVYTILPREGFHGKNTLEKIFEVVNEAIELGTDNTMVAHGSHLLKEDGKDATAIKTFLDEHPDIKKVEHKSDCIEATVAWDDTVTIFFIFGGKILNLATAQVEPELAPDVPSPASSTSMDVGTFEDVSGQGMMQATDFFFDENFY